MLIKTGTTAFEAIAIVLTAVFALGCGSGGQRTAAVSGTVIYNGKPVAKAHVSFVPSDANSRAAEGLTDDRGRFTLGTFAASDGAILGKYKIGVIARGPDRPAKPGEGSGMPGETVPGEPVIPIKYFSPDTSGLAHEVKSGGNTVELNLTD